ncbi:N-6 DNA methylase [Streptomyces echinatus]|uniref:N-6 DNA methylase n=1 Tax=Streptomyces echinatus TaxID=67293 RepID=UPI0037B883A5
MDTTPATAQTDAIARVPASRSDGLSAEARAAVEAGIPAETRRGYAGDWARFTTWCAGTGRQALPATGDTLTEYMTHLKTEDKSPATMDRSLASIAVAHAAAGLAKPSTVGARRVLKGHEAERKKSKEPRRRPRRAAAATPPVLRKMVTATDTTTAIGRRDVAVLLLGFALAARRSELRLLNWTDLRTGRHVGRDQPALRHRPVGHDQHHSADRRPFADERRETPNRMLLEKPKRHAVTASLAGKVQFIGEGGKRESVVRAPSASRLHSGIGVAERRDGWRNRHVWARVSQRRGSCGGWGSLRRRDDAGLGDHFLPPAGLTGMETTEYSHGVWKALDKLRGPLDSQVAEQLLLAVIFLRCVSDLPAAGASGDRPHWRQLAELASGRAGDHELTWALKKALDAWTSSYPGGARPLAESIPDHLVAGPLLREVLGLVDRAERPVELYEECLERVSNNKKGGNYFTPRHLVRLLVEMLAPRQGEQVFDPACGSGGFLVESVRYVREHGGSSAGMGLIGRDINAGARQVAWMNLTARGLKADLGSGPVDSLGADDTPGGAFDVVFVNPPFNLKLARDDLRYDSRWRYGKPPRSNTNFAWVQHVVSKLAARGRAAMLLPDGATFTGGATAGIRRGLVADDLVSAVVALPAGLLFPHTGISASAWIFSREKPATRRGQVLFVDAREQGHLVGRGRRTLSPGSIEGIADTYRSWCAESYQDRPGWCRSATVEEIAAREFNLQAVRYVGVPAEAAAPQPADQRVAELTRELYGHFADATRLEAELRDILGEL